MKNYHLEFNVIFLQRLADWGRLNNKVCLRVDNWFCAGIGGIYVFNEDEFNSPIFDEFLAGHERQRSDLLFDKKTNLYTVMLPEKPIYMDDLKKSPKPPIPISAFPFIRFEVIPAKEFYSLVPKEEWQQLAIFTKFWVETNTNTLEILKIKKSKKLGG